MCRDYPPKTEEAARMWQWMDAILKADPDAEWKAPIEFYGMVVNQSNQPLSGVSVTVIPSTVDGTPTISLQTDTNGRFGIKDITGKLIDVAVGKRGLRPFRSAHQAFEYFDFTKNFYLPDSTNPVVFRLWEYVNPEPVVKSDVMPRRLSVDDKVVWLDVTSGRVVDSGPVGVSVLRNSPTNWLAGYTITIHAADGGGVKLAEADDELMFTAPEDGYQPEIHLVQAPGDVYAAGKRLRFYLRTQDRKCAAVELEIAQYNVGTAGMNGQIYYNPSGSRNLQR
jgi:hypothetical protein